MSIGFIKTPLEVMELLLYILARLDVPVSMPDLTDIALCDEGVNYFEFAEALSKLEETGHVQTNAEGLISITPKGRSNGKATEEELPYSIRVRCDRNADALNRRLLRARQVRASVTPRADGSGYSARLILDDDQSNLMTLELLTPDRATGEQICRRFQESPEAIYNLLLSHLVE